MRTNNPIQAHTYTPATMEELSAVFLEHFNKKQRFITVYQRMQTSQENTTVVSLEGLSGLSPIDMANSSLTFHCGTLVRDILAVLAPTPYIASPFDAYAPDTCAGYVFSHQQVLSSDMIHQMDVVLPDGKQISLGSRAFACVAGYNAMDLFIGTKNVIGVPIRFTIKLFPRTQPCSHMIDYTGPDNARSLDDRERKIILNLKNIYDPLNLLNTRDA